MREVRTWAAADIIIRSDEVFRLQGMPAGMEPSLVLRGLLEKAVGLFYGAAEPRGVFCAMDRNDFISLYLSSGDNEPHTPLPDIVRKADYLTLFILTMGEAISAEVRRLFDEGRDDLAFTLDAVASIGVEAAAELFQATLFASYYREPGVRIKKILRYSPGYCGWGLGGQRAIVEFLHPQDIGVTITGGGLLRPVKSLSGVMITGEREIHEFRNDYPFCSRCATKTCRERIHE